MQRTIMSAAIILATVALVFMTTNFLLRRQRRVRAHLSARAIGRERPKPRPVIENASEVLVKVEFDGTVRELSEEEKKVVDTPFHPADGNRPYVKSSYDEKNGWGRLNGYLLRKDVPEGVTINPPRIIPQPLDGGRRYW
jgi:hypothetical protein